MALDPKRLGKGSKTVSGDSKRAKTEKLSKPEKFVKSGKSNSQQKTIETTPLSKKSLFGRSLKKGNGKDKEPPVLQADKPIHVLSDRYLLDPTVKAAGFVGIMISLSERGTPVAPLVTTLERSPMSKFLDSLVSKSEDLHVFSATEDDEDFEVSTAPAAQSVSTEKRPFEVTIS
jgi:hypothetical protein